MRRKRDEIETAEAEPPRGKKEYIIIQVLSFASSSIFFSISPVKTKTIFCAPRSEKKNYREKHKTQTEKMRDAIACNRASVRVHGMPLRVCV